MPNWKRTFTSLLKKPPTLSMGLPIQIVDSQGELIESYPDQISFRRQVDNALQGILVKAPIHSSLDRFRNAQLVKARVVWSTAPAPTVPVLAVSAHWRTIICLRCGPERSGKRGQTTRDHSWRHHWQRLRGLGGLQPGDKVIISGIQFLD